MPQICDSATSIGSNVTRLPGKGTGNNGKNESTGLIGPVLNDSHPPSHDRSNSNERDEEQT